MRSSFIVLGAFVLSAAHVCVAQEAENSTWTIEASKSPCDRAADLAKKLAIATLRGTDEDISHVGFGVNVNFTTEVLGGFSAEDKKTTVAGSDAARKLLKDISPHDKDADPRLFHVYLYESGAFGDRVEDLMVGGLYEAPGGKDRKLHHVATEMSFSRTCDVLAATVTYGDLRSQAYQDWVKEIEDGFKNRPSQTPSRT